MQKSSAKPRVLILHGWGGSDAPHWQDYLARGLASSGYPVFFPALPKRDTPTLDSWMDALEGIVSHFSPQIVVCHSLGNMLFLHFCKRHPEIEFDKVLLVAPPAQITDSAEIATFFPYPVPNINAKQKLLVASTDDKYSSAVDAITLAMNSGCETHIMNEAGHINSDSGYGEWDFAYEWVVA